MFGSKKLNKLKSKKFKNDSERKKYFAIKKYYQEKNENVVTFNRNKKTTKKR